MKKNIFKKTLPYLAGLLTAILTIGTILVSLFLVRIYHAPLILQGSHPTFIKSLEIIAPKYQVSFDKIIMTWKGVGKPLFIQASKMKIQAKEEKDFSVELPEMEVSFSIIGLFIGKVSVKTLEIIKPTIMVSYDNRNSPLKSSSVTEDQFILSLVDNFFKERQNLRKLKHLKIIQADFKIMNFEKEELLHFPQLMLTLEKVSKKQQFNFTDGTERKLFQLKGINDYQTNEIRIELDINYDPRDFSSSPKKNKDPQNKIVFSKDLNLPFSVKSKISYLEEEGLKEASLSVNLGQGKIDIPLILEKSLEIKKGTLEAFYANNDFQIRALEIQLGQTHLKAKMEGIWDKLSQSIIFKSKAEAENVFFKDLNKFWPVSLAIIPREWVIKNIPQGKVPYATLELEAALSLQAKKMTYIQKKLEGFIKIRDATVSYLEGMPKVTHINGEAHYSPKDFLITLESGTTHHLKLKNGRVDIRDLDKVNQSIDIQLNLHGSLSHHLALADHKPLEYAKQVGLKPSQVSGEVQTSLQLKFPLLTKITLNEIQVNIASKLRDARFSNILETFPCELQNGKFDLKVNNKNMLFEGTGHISSVPLHITWKKNFLDVSEYESKFDVSGTINSQFFEHQGNNFVQEFKGEAPLEIHYLNKVDGLGSFQAKIDLTHVQARILGWLKPEKSSGGIEVSMEMRDFKPHKLNFIRAHISDGFHIEGKGDFDKIGLKELSFPQFVIGLTNINFNIVRQTNHSYMINLLGKSLNLAPFGQGLHNSSKEPLSPSFKVKAKIDNVFLVEDKAIYNSVLDLDYKKGIINHLDFKAELSKKDPKSIFSVYLTPEEGRSRKIKLKTAYGGKFLKAFGIYDNIYGGNLSILATHVDYNSSDPWQGKFNLTDFSLKKAPLMGRLLALAFPTGMVDLFSEKGLSFSQFRSKFNATSNKIVFTKGRANGTSIGLTFAGAVDFQKKNLNLHGSVIPAYHLNTILSKIPIIGELASGGKHEGLFAVSYTISGDINKPEVAVNPISIFTPGFFRKIFEPEVDEDFEDNSDDNEYKELNN